MNDNHGHDVTSKVVEAAKRNPGGWVYKIEGNFGPDQAVPPEAIVGAWEVDAKGEQTGNFLEPKKVSRVVEGQFHTAVENFISGADACMKSANEIEAYLDDNYPEDDFIQEVVEMLACYAPGGGDEVIGEEAVRSRLIELVNYLKSRGGGRTGTCAGPGLPAVHPGRHRRHAPVVAAPA